MEIEAANNHPATSLAFLHVRNCAGGDGGMAVNTVKRELQAEGLTLAEASIVSGIGRTKLYQAIADGQLTARKYGSRTIVLRGELLRFLTSLPEVQ